MNKRKALINILTSTIFKVIIVIVTIFARSILMRQIGEEATGLFSLYTSIIGFLAIAELGVGTAITFSMYKPIINGDKDTVSALYYLYRKIYLIIFTIILAIGLLLTPLVPLLAKDNTGMFNIYGTYLLFLSAQLITYLYAHKTSFINAYLDNYITTTIHSIGLIIAAILQISVLYVTKNFTYFFVAILVGNIFQWVVTGTVFSKRYKKHINDNKILDKSIKNDVVVKVKALFLHRIGGLLVNTTDSIIISAFIGVSLLGFYSNYVAIMVGMVSVLSLIFTSITSIIGHSFAKNTKDIYLKQFKLIYTINFIVGFVFFLGYYMVIDPLVIILFDNTAFLPRDLVLIITLNYFIQFMRHTTLTFKDASGLFYQDRFKPLVEGVANVILSLILVNFWGIKGVLVATIATNIFITHIVEPHVLFKYGFEKKAKNYYLINYSFIGFFALVLTIIYFIPLYTFSNNYIAILIYGSSSVLFSLILFSIAYISSKKIREQLTPLFRLRKTLTRNTE